jgi:hypothetical protein
VSFTQDQLLSAKGWYDTKNGNRAETEKFLTSALRWDSVIAKDILDKIEDASRSQAETASKERQPEGFRALAFRATQKRQARVLPIAVGGKNPLTKWKDSEIDTLLLNDWLDVATDYIEDWANKFPDANCCEIAKPDENCMIDEDSDDFRTGFEQWAGVPFPRTFTTSARAGHKQSHWKQTDKTRALGNVMQGTTPGDVLSVRQNNLYVLSEGSQYKDCLRYYDVVDDSPTVPMPDRLVEYVEHLIALKDAEKNAKSTTDTAPRNERGKIIHGNIHSYMLSQAGRLRNAGMTQEEIEPVLLRLVHENCEPPIDESKVIQMSKSICGFPVGEDTSIVLNQVPDVAAANAPSAVHSADEILAVVKRATFDPFDPNKKVGVDYHYEGCLVSGQMVVWAAPTKGKKSSFALLKAMCDACGSDWYYFRNLKEPVKVLYLDTENSKADLHERYDEYFEEFTSKQQKLIVENLRIVFGKEIAKDSGMELELHNTGLWDVFESYYHNAAVVYLDCWYDLHDAKDSDAKTQKAALKIVLHRFKGKSLFIVQHIGREMLENLTKKNNAALRFLGGPRYINRIAQSFVLARKAEGFILQEPFELKDENEDVTEEVIDFQIWGRSIPKLPMLTFHQVAFDGEREYSFRHEIDASLSKGAASLLGKIQNKGPWTSMRALLKDAGAGYGGRQKTTLDELRFKGYVAHDGSGVRVRQKMTREVFLAAAQSPAAKNETNAFLDRVLMPNGVPNSGMKDGDIHKLAEAEGILLGGPLMYEGVRPETVDGETIWKMTRHGGRLSLAEAERLQGEVKKLIEADPAISKKELVRRLNSGKVAIDGALETLGYHRAGKTGTWKNAENSVIHMGGENC